MFDGLNDTRPLLSRRVIRLGREPTIHIQDGAIDEPAFLIGVARRPYGENFVHRPPIAR
jgi:hypothetical protein